MHANCSVLSMALSDIENLHDGRVFRSRRGFRVDETIADVAGVTVAPAIDELKPFFLEPLSPLLAPVTAKLSFRQDCFAREVRVIRKAPAPSCISICLVEWRIKSVNVARSTAKSAVS